MAGPLLWLEALAGFKALFDLLDGAPDYYERLRAHMLESDTIRESKRAAEVFSTYSDEEIRSVVKRIEGCRDRFISQGGGSDRAQCLCSIFNELRSGNGGILPHIDDWARMYSQLKCDRAYCESHPPR